MCDTREVLARLTTATLIAAWGCGDGTERPFVTTAAEATTEPGSTTTGVGEETGPGDEGPSSTTAGTTGVAETGDESSSDDGQTKFDTPDGVDTEGVDCECGNDEFSYIWIANSGQSTVSKINTREVVEEGRYLTRPDGAGNPSRTSVSVDGKAVVVANRFGGLTKIWTLPADCDPAKNGVPGLQTSTGQQDVLPWGEDDCVEWHTPFADMSTQRPVQWTPGTLDPMTCEYVDQKVWTVTGKNGAPGQCGMGGVWAHVLDGDTGAIENTVHVPEQDFPCQPDPFAPYGGAVDLEDNFWFISRGGDKLVRVELETMAYEVFSVPFAPYGITVDTKGRVWSVAGNTAMLGRFDYQTQQWDTSAGAGLYGGLQQGPDGRIWAANYVSGIVWVDPETMQVGGTFQPPGNGQMKGVSVDIDGFVWTVRRDTDRAFKIDPDTFAYETYVGLTTAYTYSDMTGGAINNITCNPEP